MTEASNRPRVHREGLLLPLLIPLGAVVVIAGVLFGFSRVLLAVDPNAATAVAVVVAASILGVAAFVATRPRVGERAILSLVSSVAGIGLVAAGIAILAFPLAAEGPGGSVVNLAAPVDAASKGFEQTSLSAPAGTAFTLAFHNMDSGVTHNVEIFDGADATAPKVFSGTLITGGLTADYAVGPLDAGTYFFHCQVHPTTMTGTLTVTEGGGGGSGGPTTEIKAQNLTFDTDTIRLPADTPTTITFDNQDTALHNLAIFQDDTLAKTLFTAPDVPPGSSAQLDVPALPPAPTSSTATTTRP